MKKVKTVSHTQSGVNKRLKASRLVRGCASLEGTKKKRSRGEIRAGFPVEEPFIRGRRSL